MIPPTSVSKSDKQTWGGEATWREVRRALLGGTGSATRWVHTLTDLQGQIWLVPGGGADEC